MPDIEHPFEFTVLIDRYRPELAAVLVFFNVQPGAAAD
jgi:hypothetical protein